MRFALFLALVPLTLQAQTTPSRTIEVIHSYGAGAIATPQGGDWQLDYTNVYDDGTRPVLQLSNDKAAITASVMLFDNYYKKITPEGCRKDATDGILQNQAAAITDRRDFMGKAADGTPVALTTWVIHGNPTTIRQRNLFAFASDAAVCYEVHLSKPTAEKEDEADLQRALPQFPIRLGYKPDGTDYFVMASLLYRKSPKLAAPYYRQALDRTPADAQNLTQYRIITDQLVMSLGMGGDLKASRAVAQKAIEADPDYPLNYYNLACADAEQGDAAQARVHLEQAFARKQNTLPGEHLPDPSTDDSFLKLKDDKQFWSYVQTLK